MRIHPENRQVPATREAAGGELGMAGIINSRGCTPQVHKQYGLGTPPLLLLGPGNEHCRDYQQPVNVKPYFALCKKLKSMIQRADHRRAK